ncbi:hypothetical protein [Halomonas sp. NO4]|uniref:hypothetical protein n=1 Tax=Halomonas sp. NO4 TaxID=2484813 RepID=UPI0013D5A161|nr:hypothetical protein [Halomonas sp. NO4]
MTVRRTPRRHCRCDPAKKARRAGVALLLAACVLLLTGCAGRLVPPAEVADPVDVYLLDHGRHASLVLPHHESGVVRYSYGDWQWYVEGQRHLLSATAAMLWPTSGALGRRVDEGLALPRELSRLAPEGVAESYSLVVERSRARALSRRLDARFAAAAPGVESPTFNLVFVRDPRGYWLAHQSNLVVADWLEELGVEVQGLPWLSRWRLDP